MLLQNLAWLIVSAPTFASTIASSVACTIASDTGLSDSLGSICTLLGAPLFAAVPGAQAAEICRYHDDDGADVFPARSLRAAGDKIAGGTGTLTPLQ